MILPSFKGDKGVWHTWADRVRVLAAALPTMAWTYRVLRLTVRRCVYSAEIEQDDWQQRVWLDSVTTKKVRSRPCWSVIFGSKRVQGVAYFSARFFFRKKGTGRFCNVHCFGVAMLQHPKALLRSGSGGQLRASNVDHSSASCVARGQRTKPPQ